MTGGERIAYLLNQQLTGNISNAELDELELLIRQPGNRELFNISMQQMLGYSNEEMEKDDPEWDQRILGILETDKIRETIPSVHRIHFLKTAWFKYPPSGLALRWASAAAIIILLGTGAYLWINKTSTKNSLPITVVKSDSIQNILPGGSKQCLHLLMAVVLSWILLLLVSLHNSQDQRSLNHPMDKLFTLPSCKILHNGLFLIL